MLVNWGLSSSVHIPSFVPAVRFYSATWSQLPVRLAHRLRRGIRFHPAAHRGSDRYLAMLQYHYNNEFLFMLKPTMQLLFFTENVSISF